MMKRREFMTLLGGVAAAWPLTAHAQQDGRIRRIGVLSGNAEGDLENQTWFAAFRQDLERLGWSEGRNIRIDYRFAAAGPVRFQAFAKELLALQPDVIFANTTPAAAALQHESRVVPIVFTGVSDPIGSGFVASLARPGGNLTGFLLIEASIAGKWLEMLKEIEPRLTRAAFVANPKTTPYDYFLRAAEAAASLLAIELVPIRVETAADIERSIEVFGRVPNGGLVLPPDTTTRVHRDLIIALAARYRLPAVWENRVHVPAGALMSYGASRAVSEGPRQAASYIDRILRGEKPADLPVQAPTRYETVLNLKTAKALGLTVPDLMIVAADEVIE
jgi:putative tryptophan/tyrosine transport system substrate-binding protein